MEAKRLVLIVTLEVRHADAEGYARYEELAEALMGRHGGRIERVVRLDEERGDGMFREVHIVSFTDAAALEAYRGDPDAVALRELRGQVIQSTEILRGYDVASPGGEAH
jgi:uncharacterized protein (DUF1330 family)